MKAMLLCAGYGTRLGSLTREIPKPMLPIHGRPMIEYLLANLRRAGVTEVIINLHFRPELIRSHLGDGSRWNLKIDYSEEPALLGTAGGLKRAEAFFLGEKLFLVHYGDVLTDQDFRPMIEAHHGRKAMATLLVHRRERSNSVVEIDRDSRIVGFLERPDDAARQGVVSNWVNSGVCVAGPELLEHIPADRASDLPCDVFPEVIATGRLYAFPLAAYRCAIDSPERLAEAAEALARGACRIDPPHSIATA